MGYNNSVQEIGKKLRICIEILYKKDLFLIESSVSERSIGHKLAEYLQVGFQYWNVDCECNRIYEQVKELRGTNECSAQRITERIYPDIIVHEGNTAKNLVVIEIKVNIDGDSDIKKLEKLTSTVSEFSYKVGYFIRFSKEEERHLIRRFQGGREVP